MQSKRGSSEADLLAGVAASYLLNEHQAEALLRRYLARHDQPFGFHAGYTLAGVQTRLGRYADATATLRSALAPAKTKGVRPEQVRSAQQSLMFVEALQEVPRQVGPEATSGRIEIQRDAAGLPRGSLAVNGHVQSAVLDTGANYSVMIRSKANALGLRVLPRAVTIASPISDQTPAQLAVADRLTVGGATFRNVVFIVFPDEALTFAKGAYRIEMILGFPVLANLGRLQFSANGTAEHMAFARPASRPLVAPSSANLFVEEQTPKVIACSIPQRLPLQFALDSGADASSLRPLFGTTFPSLVGDARRVTSNQGGVGGTVGRESRVISKVRLDFSGTKLTLRNLSMSEEASNEPADYGRLGQDVLRAKGGYVLDFTQMRFELGGDIPN